MWSIANLFDSNIRTFDAKKHNFFCTECLEYVNHKEKLIFKNVRTTLVYLRLNFS